MATAASPPPPATSLLELGNDSLRAVLLLLDVRTVCTVAQVCRRLNGLAQEVRRGWDGVAERELSLGS